MQAKMQKPHAAVSIAFVAKDKTLSTKSLIASTILQAS
jgi:hypothetical protein